MDYEDRLNLQTLSAYIGSDLTEEQMEFASDFRKSTISFSDPGTGKTHTLVAGLVMAQKYHNVPGSKINCMSFTRAATIEVKSRYDALCKRCSVPNSVMFKTFHALSLLIMGEAYPDAKVVDEIRLADALPDIQRYLAMAGLECNDMDFCKKVLKAVNTLNAALMFHPDEISRQYQFQDLGLSIEQFQLIRKHWFLRSKTMGEIVKGDIPLYCLYALLTMPTLGPKWKGRFDIMIVDEFQDLSLLHLHILSFISDTLIVIGDMKQQIYAFNGACPQIVQAYLRLHPDARVCNLTKSFRCAQEIADYATEVIKSNDESIVPFTGIRTGGSVQIVKRSELNWEEIAERICDDISKHRLADARQVMFLYRNNASAIPIMEQLYKLKVPFRSSKFARVMDVPIFKDLCTLANAAWEPTDVQFVTKALRLFPEFSGIPYNQKPTPITVMEHTGKSLFEINYRWREKSSIDLLLAMQVASKKIQEKKSAGIVLNNLLEVYERYVIKHKWWMFDNTREFYFNLVAPICNSKDYPTMFNEENDKMNINKQNLDTHTGVRCYTMHSAKGLEADDVYILDCDEGLFPNSKVLKRKEEAGCLYDAACDIRSERNLLYVALTRAKENVIISYSGDSPAELLVNPRNNNYVEFDEIYREEQVDFDNVTEFMNLFRIEVGDESGNS